MQRSQQREHTRLARQAMIESMNRQRCCPLSFCQSLEHHCLQDCNHPYKFRFVIPFHNNILDACSQYCSMEDDVVTYNVGATYSVDEFMDDLVQNEFSEDNITEEQLDLLLIHLQIPVMTYWGVTVRQEKIRIIMEKYNDLLQDMRWNETQERLFEQAERDLPPRNLLPELDMQEMMQSPLENDPPMSHRYNYFYSEDGSLDNVFELEKPIQVIYNESRNEFMSSSTGEEMECPICYDKECFILTQCGHAYCECFITYASTISIETDVNCPCCRSAVSTVEFTHKKSYRITKALVSQQPSSSRFRFAEESTKPLTMSGP